MRDLIQVILGGYFVDLSEHGFSVATELQAVRLKIEALARSNLSDKDGGAIEGLLRDLDESTAMKEGRWSLLHVLATCNFHDPGRPDAVIQLIGGSLTGSLDEKDINGDTPLMIAAHCNNTHVARWLLAKGAKMGEENPKQTVEDIAQASGSEAVLTSLRSPTCQGNRR